MGYHSEALYESDELPKAARDHAALVASKVYYFLGEYDEALSFALGAGSAFHAETRTYGSEEYIETIVCASRSFDFDILILNYFWQPKLLTAISKRELLSSQAAKRRLILACRLRLKAYFTDV